MKELETQSVGNYTFAEESAYLEGHWINGKTTGKGKMVLKDGIAEIYLEDDKPSSAFSNTDVLGSDNNFKKSGWTSISKDCLRPPHGMGKSWTHLHEKSFLLL